LATMKGPTLKNVDVFFDQTFQILQTAHNGKIATEGNSKLKDGDDSTQHRVQNSAV